MLQSFLSPFIVAYVEAVWNVYWSSRLNALRDSSVTSFLMVCSRTCSWKSNSFAGGVDILFGGSGIP